MDDLPGLRILSAALCSWCLRRMFSAFLWFVLISGAALISVAVRLFLMAFEAVERARLGSRFWYSSSVKSDSWPSTSLTLKRGNTIYVMILCHIALTAKQIFVRVEIVLFWIFSTSLALIVT